MMAGEDEFKKPQIDFYANQIDNSEAQDSGRHRADEEMEIEPVLG